MIEESKIITINDELAVVTEEPRKFAAKNLENGAIGGPTAEKPFDMNEFEELDEKTKKGKATDEEEKRFEEMIPAFAKTQVE